MVVLVLIALLAGIVAPIVTRSIERAKESTLKENLMVTRRALDNYYADKGRYPDILEDLVRERYLRSVPVDPITERSDSWILLRDDPGDAGTSTGIFDLHSGSSESSSEGVPYREW